VGRDVAAGTSGVDDSGLFISDWTKSYQSHGDKFSWRMVAPVDLRFISVTAER
jgi:hypothetical protein